MTPSPSIAVEAKTQAFERHPALASWIERLATTQTGLSLGEWMIFVGSLNAALDREALAALKADQEEGETWHERLRRQAKAGDYAAALATMRTEFPALKTPPAIPADVGRLVVAARAVAFGAFDKAALKELDTASEAFAARLPWDDEPLNPSQADQEDHGLSQDHERSASVALEWRGIVSTAFAAGCQVAHDNYEPDYDPDFGEAAHDYAASVAGQIETLLTPSTPTQIEIERSRDDQ